ncbi:MAG: site-2 protease family protein [Acidimicrobiales bacterium]
MRTTRTGVLRLGRVGGIQILIHWSWIIIAGLLTAAFWAQLTDQNPDLSSGAGWLLAGLGSLLFFGSILAHELAHALTAVARGIEVKGITLYLFGGATEADASSRSAFDELVIALAGPLTSLVLAGALGVIGLVIGDPLGSLLGYLAVLNIVLVAFNMAPGLPLDGGRVFRAIVWGATGDFAKATRWATTAGVALGYLLIWLGVLAVLAGALSGLWLAAIGWMISQSARTTGEQERLREAFTNVVAGEVMTSPVVSIPPSCLISAALTSYFRQASRTVYPVADADGIVGLVDLREVARLEPDELASKTIGDIAVPIDPGMICTPSTPMGEVIESLAGSTGGDRVLVVDDGALLGIISAADIVRRSTLVDLLRLAER